MAETVLKSVKVIIGGYDVSGQSNAVTLNYSAEMLDSTVFGSSARKRKAGLTDAQLNVSGWWGSSDVDKNLWDFVGGSVQNVSVTPTTVVGDSAFLLGNIISEYSVGGAVGNLLPFDIVGMSDPQSPAIISGAIMEGVSSSTSTSGFSSTTPVNIGTGSTLQNLYVSGHVTSFSSGVSFWWRGQLQVSASSAFSTAVNYVNVFSSGAPTTARAGFWATTKAPTTKGWMRLRWFSSGGGVNPKIKFFVTAGIK